ncbi:MAG: PD-(D/E)XK nuclease family protein [candidate division WOR-3 bacterium]|nr:MAG: PD-(D/E)XK nuclease family protein [candidate division WOR-3 bacterium]
MPVIENNTQARKRTISLSVCELVEYTMRSGDLSLVFFSTDRPIQGVFGHQTVQAMRPKEYRAEVPLRHVVETEEYRLTINGRIDGIYEYGDHAIIDEIKTTRKPLETVSEQDNSLHWGQAKCYAYLYALQNGLERIGVQLTYYQLEEEKTKEIRRTYSTSELAHFFRSLLSKYVSWAQTYMDWIEVRNRSTQNIQFPFEAYRPGQEQMVSEAASAIDERQKLLIQAPTGVGKTIAVIFSAVQAMGRGLESKFFYLTARTTGKIAAEYALDILRSRGARLKHVSLTAKEKICFNPDKTCDGDDCLYARGYYDRVNDALADAFRNDSFTRDTILGFAQKYRICPFEFSLEVSLWVDCIICDYNYVFDPRVFLRRFFSDGENGYVLLVDEAHNLVDRSREMYSATLNRRSFMELRKQLRPILPGLYRSMGKVGSWMMKAKKKIPENNDILAVDECPLDLCQLLRKFTSEAEQWLSKNEQASFRQEILDIYFDARRFLNTAERYDDNYATYYASNGRDISVRLFCLDPSEHLEGVLQRCSSAIFFSATLTPFDYFSELFGCSGSTRTLSVPSPFPRSNICVLIAGKISALYRYREFTKDEVAKMIGAMIGQKRGSYLIFFPSYEYMRIVHEIFQKRYARMKVIIQSPGMSETERDAFLAHFSGQTDGFLVGFVVMGGFFAESIDLVGERLTGAAVVGVGFPQISIERELIRAHFDKIDGSGYAFAYQVPGMIKVLQAAGRVIRSESDRGVVLLIDTRYSDSPYRQMLPKEWRPAFVANVERAATLLQEFWGRQGVLSRE